MRRIGAVCGEFQSRYRAEIVLVDDGSRIDSLEVAKQLIDVEPRLRVIELRRNFGQTAALQAGLSCARGDFIVSMDSDLQHFPEDIPQVLSSWPSRVSTWSAAGARIGARMRCGAGRRGSPTS